MAGFEERLSLLKQEIVAQGRRVLDLCTRAVECHFDGDQGKAREVVKADEAIDTADVAIERASVPLLAMGQTNEHAIRSVLTIVKVNNELERIADDGVAIAEKVLEPHRFTERVPDVFRVMANSVLGVLRDATRSLEREDPELARQVLLFDDTVAQFKAQILRETETAVTQASVGFAFRLLAVTKALERIADHATNICEQVIYLKRGLIVRHRPEGWSEPEAPASR
ncbi:MAG: phosphate transport system regulatory protein PhoU [Planctomycetes bacterium]|nr:phosphate transport system regulatory protein PhoU [Planctomycetota bacterium]